MPEGLPHPFGDNREPFSLCPVDPRSLDLLGGTGLDAQAALDTLGAVVKERDDLELVQDNLEEITSGA